MAIQPAGVWGIDLGQCALKALRVENVEGQITATAFDYVEHPKILSQPDADPDQLTREALEKFLSRNSIRGDIVAMSVPGQSGLARFVKLPPVEEKKIPDIVRFEAKQQIPFNLDEVVWDYQKLNSGAVSDGFAMETEIGLFAIKRDAVSRALQQFREVKVEVHIVQMAPLALCNFVAYDLLGQGGEGNEEAASKKRCVVALDIGADNSNLVITDGQRIIWQRPIPLGGNHFTRALTKDLKLTFAKAEHLKRNATKSPDLKKILSALKPVLNDFVGEVQRSLGYFTNTHRDANILYMIGLGNAFRLPGIQKFLSEKLQLEVRKLQKLERLIGDGVVDAPAYTENVLSFGVAYGLALQGLEVGRLTTNLLPQEIQVERLIRAKKPWVAAAAAALLLGTSAMTLGYTVQNRTYASKPVQDAIKASEDVTKEAAKWEGDCKTRQGEIETASKDVKTIVAGQEERLNWMHLVKFIDDALPRPDGSNLSEAQRPRTNPPQSIKAYYFNEKAQDAFKKYQARRLTGTASGDLKGDDSEGLADLIHINIESVLPMYTEDLAGYVSRLQQQPILAAAMETMRKEDRENPPKENANKGWVVELRGYTSHKANRQFVVETLVENLARLKYKKPEEGDAATGTTPAPGTTPAAGTAPASPAAPATPPASPPAGAQAPAAGESQPPLTDAEKEQKAREAKADPILGNVSHVILLRHVLTEPDPSPFQLISTSMLSGLLAGGGGMGMGGEGPAGMGGPGMAMMGKGSRGAEGDAGPGGMGGGMGSTRDSWQPLSGGAVSGGGGDMAGGPGGRMGAPGGEGRAGGGMAMGGGKRMGGGMAGPGGPGGPMGGAMMPGGMMPGGMPGGGMASGGEMPNPLDLSKPKKDQLRRTEFIVLFIWREPTPSDDLLTPQDSVAPADGGGGPGGPAGAGAPGGAVGTPDGRGGRGS